MFLLHINIYIVCLLSYQQGHCDFPLTDLGIDQAVKRGHSLKEIHWDYAYSSDLPRASRTAEIILSHSETIFNKDDLMRTALLREISFGVREELPRGTTVYDAKLLVAERQQIPVSEVIDTAETKEQVHRRQVDFIKQLQHHCMNSNHIPTILCVSHGAFIRQFLTTFCPMLPVVSKIGNCSVTIVTVSWPDLPTTDTTADSTTQVIFDTNTENNNNSSSSNTNINNNSSSSSSDTMSTYSFQCHTSIDTANMCL